MHLAPQQMAWKAWVENHQVFKKKNFYTHKKKKIIISVTLKGPFLLLRWEDLRLILV